ncbi:MAG: hypothetical protein AB1508_16840 [Pseudomonadota bacterium]
MNPGSKQILRSDGLPIPPYLSQGWFDTHGISDVDLVLANLRSESCVMRPARLRAIKATPLSFARSLVKRMIAEKWRIERRLIDIDRDGVGKLIYRIFAAGRDFTFVVFSRRSDGTEHPGRIFESNFDLLAALFEGDVDDSRIEHEQQQLDGRLWQGRTDNSCLGWTLANRSVRFFNHIVEHLTQGRQPDKEFLKSGGGYIIRNAGWYGNGRFGSRSWKALGPRHPFSYPYHLDIFPLYLWRTVGFDIVETMARLRNPGAAAVLSAHTKAWMGIGNSSGIGMVAALVRWPAWMSAYNFPRELALAIILSQRGPVDTGAAESLCRLLRRAIDYYAEQPDSLIKGVERASVIKSGLEQVAMNAERMLGELSVGRSPKFGYWRAVTDFADMLGTVELSEQVNALLIQAHPEISDAMLDLFQQAMKVERTLDPTMDVAELRSIIARRYRWALEIDQLASGARKYFWYRSEENGENRRGERVIDPGEERESFVDVVGSIHALSADLARQNSNVAVAEFLLRHPEMSHAVSRVQLAAGFPYTEIRGNIIDANFLPMDGIRFLLSTMGLESSHPNSNQWVRGTFLQGAPLPEAIKQGIGDDWALPSLETQHS